MHAITNGFEPSRPDRRRPAWNEDTADWHHIPPEDVDANRERDRLANEIASWHHDDDEFGLIHQDAHQWNLTWDGSTVTLFDFDDSGYGHFARDLAIVMYYGAGREDTDAALADIWPPFIAGYQAHHHLRPEWCARFPTFFSWRDHLMYSIVIRSREALIEDDVDVDAWIARFKERHAAAGPLVEYDFPLG